VLHQSVARWLRGAPPSRGMIGCDSIIHRRAPWPDLLYEINLETRAPNNIGGDRAPERVVKAGPQYATGADGRPRLRPKRPEYWIVSPEAGPAPTRGEREIWDGSAPATIRCGPCHHSFFRCMKVSSSPIREHAAGTRRSIIEPSGLRGRCPPDAAPNSYQNPGMGAARHVFRGDAGQARSVPWG
jgi:hypothetical protein